jgi:hypothetical protein
MRCLCGDPLTAFHTLYAAGLSREEAVCPACGRFWIAYHKADPPEVADPHATVLTFTPTKNP